MQGNCGCQKDVVLIRKTIRLREPTLQESVRPSSKPAQKLPSRSLKEISVLAYQDLHALSAKMRTFVSRSHSDTSPEEINREIIFLIMPKSLFTLADNR